MNMLDSKVCIVTGAGGGIGSSICQAFVSEGAGAVIAVEHQRGTVDQWKVGCRNMNHIFPYTAEWGAHIEDPFHTEDKLLQILPSAPSWILCQTRKDS